MGRKRIPLELRFWAKVQKTDGCWFWTASVTPKGYGIICKNGENARAHRVAYELTYGAIPDCLFVCHTCDVRTCVRPDHLFLGTPHTNMKDMINKNRDLHFRGSDHSQAILTEMDVTEIRRLRARPNPPSYARIGVRYGVRAMTVYRAAKGHTWKHVTVR